MEIRQSEGHGNTYSEMVDYMTGQDLNLLLREKILLEKVRKIVLTCDSYELTSRLSSTARKWFSLRNLRFRVLRKKRELTIEVI